MLLPHLADSSPASMLCKEDVETIDQDGLKVWAEQLPDIHRSNPPSANCTSLHLMVDQKTS